MPVIEDQNATLAPVIGNLSGSIRTASHDNVLLDAGSDVTITSDAAIKTLSVHCSDLKSYESIGIRTGFGVTLSNGTSGGSTVTVQNGASSVVCGTIGSLGTGFYIIFNASSTNQMVETVLKNYVYNNSSTDFNSVEQHNTINIDLSDVNGSQASSTVSLLVAPDAAQFLTTAVDSLVGTASSDTFYSYRQTVNAGDAIDGGGGIDTFELRDTHSTSINLTTFSSFSKVEIIRGTNVSENIFVTAQTLADVQTLDGGGGLNDVLILSGNAFDLSAKSIVNFKAINTSDSNVLVHDFGTAALVNGSSAFEQVTVTAATLSLEQRQTLFNNEIDSITDQSGTTYVNAPPQVAGFDSGRIGVRVGQTLFVDVGRDAEVTDDNGLIAHVTMQLYNSDQYDHFGLDTAGSITLSNGLTTGSIVSISGTVIGEIYYAASTYADFKLNADATPARTQELLRAITYLNANPTTALLDHDRTIQVVILDKGSKQVTSTFTIEQEHLPPTGIALDHLSIAENSPLSTVVGNLSALDPNTGENLKFALIDDADRRFTINSAKQLVVADPSKLDFEEATTHQVTVRVTDKDGLTFDQTFTIAVEDIVDNRKPSQIGLDHVNVAENSAAGTVVGDVSALDPDADDTFTFTLDDDAGGSGSCITNLSSPTGPNWISRPALRIRSSFASPMPAACISKRRLPSASTMSARKPCRVAQARTS